MKPCWICKKEIDDNDKYSHAKRLDRNHKPTGEVVCEDCFQKILKEIEEDESC